MAKAVSIKIEARIHFRRLALLAGRALAALGCSEDTCIRAAAGLMVVRMRTVTESGAPVGGWTWQRLSTGRE